MSDFEKELAALINRHSIENETDTPDFILARYINDCLNALGTLIDKRDNWSSVDNVQEVNDINMIQEG